MFEGITFVEFCNDRGGAEDGSSFIVAIRGLNYTGFHNLECLVYAAAETMTAYDSMEEKVREILNNMGAEYEVIYPNRYITIC